MSKPHKQRRKSPLDEDGTISIELGSTAGPDALVDADGFALALHAHIRALRMTAEFVAKNGEADIRFELVSLSLNSPPVAVLRGIIQDDEEDVLREAERQFFEIVEAAGTGNELPELPHPLLTAMKEIADTNKRYSIKSRVRTKWRSVHVPPRLGTRLEVELADDLTMQGSAFGQLKYINLHSKNVMRLYSEPEFGIPYVTCKFPSWLAEKAAKLVRKHVIVDGELFYRKGAAHPHHVEVTDVREIEPLPAPLPFSASYGMALAPASRRTAEDLFPEIRRGW